MSRNISAGKSINMGGENKERKKNIWQICSYVRRHSKRELASRPSWARGDPGMKNLSIEKYA